MGVKVCLNGLGHMIKIVATLWGCGAYQVCSNDDRYHDEVKLVKVNFSS